MKKLICAAVSSMLSAALLVPVAAFADTTISQTDDSSPSLSESGATVEFSVNPTFTVTIPAKITLADDGTGIYTNSGNVTAEDVFLKEGQTIVVSLSSASEFNMKTSDTAEYQLPYTASTTDFGKLTDKKKGGIVAKFNNAKNTQTAAVTFTTDEEPQFAGVYSDPVIFTIAVTES